MIKLVPEQERTNSNESPFFLLVEEGTTVELFVKPPEGQPFRIDTTSETRKYDLGMGVTWFVKFASGQVWLANRSE